MATSLKLIYFISFFLFGCNQSNQNCSILQNDVIELNESKMISDFYDSIFVVKDIGKDTILGGLYSFYPNGNLKSYYFIAKIGTQTDTTPKTVLVMEGNPSEKSASFCSYAEVYNLKGEISDTYGSPLVYQDLFLQNGDSLSMDLYFFDLNKTYSDIRIRILNRVDTIIALKKDTLYSNMKVGSMSKKLAGTGNVKIYFEYSFVNECNKVRRQMRDSFDFDL